MISNLTIEEKIFSAAKEVFLEKGLEASTMSDIAKRAGISRTLLNYYHRKKEKLFHSIFIEAVNEMLPKIERIVQADLPLIKKAELIIDSYIELLLRNPLLPHFMILEVYRDPKTIMEIFRYSDYNTNVLGHLEKQISQEFDLPKEYSIAHFFCSVYSLMVFPFIAKPILDEKFFKNDPKAFRKFIIAQKPIILGMVVSLQKKN